MLSFFGTVPKQALFQPISQTNFLFDNKPVEIKDEESVAGLRNFCNDLKDDIEKRGRFSVRTCQLIDVNNSCALSFRALHNATTNIELVSLDKREPLTPRFTVHSDKPFVATLEKLLQK